MKSIDLFCGVKAEQTLRDAARAATESSPDDADVLELVPEGKKNWLCGARIGSAVRFGELEQIRGDVLKRLIALDSHQRIRAENVRVWPVQPPVPVFKDMSLIEELPADDPPPETPATPEERDEALICPVCGAKVHRYNIQYNAAGEMVGCYLCRGEAVPKS
jgi:hypothetical protein